MAILLLVWLLVFIEEVVILFSIRCCRLVFWAVDESMNKHIEDMQAQQSVHDWEQGLRFVVKLW